MGGSDLCRHVLFRKLWETHFFYNCAGSLKHQFVTLVWPLKHSRQSFDLVYISIPTPRYFFWLIFWIWLELIPWYSQLLLFLTHWSLWQHFVTPVWPFEGGQQVMLRLSFVPRLCNHSSITNTKGALIALSVFCISNLFRLPIWIFWPHQSGQSRTLSGFRAAWT